MWWPACTRSAGCAGRRDRYHRLGFTVPFTVAAILTPVQFMLGDSIARAVFHKQP
jgi:cytochrome d ubiquinol oxidase subunit I